jgi:hypothetical protein
MKGVLMVRYPDHQQLGHLKLHTVDLCPMVALHDKAKIEVIILLGGYDQGISFSNYEEVSRNR